MQVRRATTEDQKGDEEMATTSIRIVGLDGVLRTLQSLPGEIVSRNGGPVRSALQKAAKVIQREALLNLQKIITQPNVGDNESTGLLAKNVVVSRSRLGGGLKGESYLVRVRNKSYTDAKGKRVTTAQVARLLEYGSEKRAPLPWIRPAFETKKQEAVNTFVTEINKGIARIVKKLERQNRVKS